MERTTLGRTGLSVSVAGMGSGGYSRLGQAYGNSVGQSVAVVQAAIGAGVNFIDTAAVYGTEEIVGQAVKNCRDRVVISSKLIVTRPGTSPLGQDFLTGAEFAQQAEKSLSRLGTDRIDIYHLHGIMPDQYDYCLSELVPALEQLRDQGKIKYLGLTERFIHDPGHKMLQRALQDDCWDVVMTGFNLINQSARHRVLAKTREKNVGTLVMFAVRRALGSDEAIREIVQELAGRGEIDASALDAQNPLDFLTAPGVADSVIDAAYRYCRHEPGVQVVLTGTGSSQHLAENLASIEKPALPGGARDVLKRVFGQVDSVSGN